MKSLRKIFHPELFQGSFRKNNYFEGWYFKHVSADTKNAFAVIPGISLSGDRHSFIQFIEGNSGRSWYFRYDTEQFRSNPKYFFIEIGNSTFSLDGIDLNLSDGITEIRGKISYSALTPLTRTILQPGIMGWYSYIPTMECNHGVLSMNHKLEGWVSVENNNIDFSKGSGYSEKDWGISFPESWLWLQCNSFSNNNTSVMISVAKIPWRGHYFIGFISALSLNGNPQVFATYNGSKILKLLKTETGSEIVIKRGKITIEALITGKGAGYLKAPSNGLMINNIRESINSSVILRVTEKNRVIFEGSGERAGYEETPLIFTYF